MITRSQVAALYPRATPARIDAFATAAPHVLPRFGFDQGPHRLPFLLAQLGHESGGLTIIAENLNYSAARMRVIWPSRFPTLASAAPFAANPERLANAVYANRMGNGPPESGDGFRFRGRGLIQLTGRDGYRQVGRRIGLPLEDHPSLAAEAQHLLLVAAGFWDWKKLHPVCDSNDFRKCTKSINGGYIGIEDRLQWLDKARRVLAQVPPRRAQPSAAIVIAVQKALQLLGFAAIGAADGLIGQRTVTAITSYRQQQGMPPGDPQHPIDDALLQKLGIG